MSISKDRMEKSLTYLSETDIPCAEQKAKLNGLRDQLKTVYGMLYLEAQGKSVEEKKASVYAHEDYKDHLKKIQETEYEYEIMRNKRLTETLVVECWRSINANRRQG